MLERVPQRDENAIGVEWLLEEIVGAELRRLHCGLNGPMPADHDDDGVRVCLLQPLQCLQPIDTRHLHVHKNEVWTKSVVLGDRVDRVARRLHLVPLVLEELAERLTNALLVVDDEDASAHRCVDLYSVTRSWPMRTSAMN